MALVFLFMLVNYADKAVIGLSSVPLMRDLALTNVQFGELGSAFFLLFSVSGIVGGVLANRIKSKTLLFSMAVAWGLALLPVSLVSSFWVLLLSRVVLGAAEGPAFPIAVHAVYKWFPDHLRALPTSVIACGAAFGAGVVAPAITWIIVHHGWHAAFGTLGAVGLLWATLWFWIAAEGPVDAVALTPPKARPHAASSTAVQSPLTMRVPYRCLLTSHTAIGVFLGGFAAYWIVALNITWLANYLIKVQHLAPTQAAWVVGLPSVLQLILAPCMALLSQWLIRHDRSTRLARGKLGALCVIAAGISTLCMACLPLGMLKVALIGLGFSVGSVIFTLGSTLIGEISPPPQRGAMLGITNSIHTLAGLGAPLVMGWMVDGGVDTASGFKAGYLYTGALVALLGLVAAIIIDPQGDLRRFRRMLKEQ